LAREYQSHFYVYGGWVCMCSLSNTTLDFIFNMWF